jgi:hypothetical protein
MEFIKKLAHLLFCITACMLVLWNVRNERVFEGSWTKERLFTAISNDVREHASTGNTYVVAHLDNILPPPPAIRLPTLESQFVPLRGPTVFLMRHSTRMLLAML